ncbi:tripartite tricarboxylate transporter TctB family protein [Pinirhizobacter sp.]|jgi:hypothetical protein|uniref:tripartite tricarboxylate transporter TctB family protein n=1 Tax=Pinirhizobacter sp. TaxID=2950432 RepID=UPI002F40C1DE
MLKDLIGGLLLLSLAALYYHFSLSIQHSSLSDAVGADGFPKGLAAILGGLSVILIAKSVVQLGLALHRGTLALGIDPELIHSILRALGMLAIAVGFLYLLPYAGYPLAVVVLIAVVGVYQRRPFAWPLWATSIGGAAIFWGLFVYLLEIPLPTGSWFGGA